MISKKIISIISLFFMLCISFVRFNFIVGSKYAWFSCANIVIPVLGFQQSLLYVIFYFFSKGLCTFSFSIMFLVRRIPTLMATLALRNWDYKVAVLFPLLAMILFCVHPIGSQVYYYSWYWFIPIGLYCLGRDTVYHRSLIASFVAHATGSVIWLYTVDIAPVVWQALLPIVAIERLFIAGGMVACSMILQAVKNLYCDKVTA